MRMIPSETSSSARLARALRARACLLCSNVAHERAWRQIREGRPLLDLCCREGALLARCAAQQVRHSA
eukprot:646151-Pleurochrysis_carterae.AAC.3